MVEILARLVVQRAAFFSDGWNIFDAVVVGVAVAPATAAFSVLRVLRVLRLLRLITAVPALQRVVGGLIRALPGMGSILLLICLIFLCGGGDGGYLTAPISPSSSARSAARCSRCSR